MKIMDVGEVIATRTLVLGQNDASHEEVSVLLGRPQQLPGHPDYYCPYQIRGAGADTLSYACGIDSFQALLLALSTIEVELGILKKQFGGELRWDCGKQGALGFPVMPPASL